MVENVFRDGDQGLEWSKIINRISKIVKMVREVLVKRLK